MQSFSHYPPRNPPFYRMEHCKKGRKSEVNAQDVLIYRTCIKNCEMHSALELYMLEVVIF